MKTKKKYDGILKYLPKGGNTFERKKLIPSKAFQEAMKIFDARDKIIFDNAIAQTSVVPSPQAKDLRNLDWDRMVKEIKEIEDIPRPSMPYSFVMSVESVKIIKDQTPPKHVTIPHLMGTLNGVRTFALSNEKFKEICEKQLDVNDSNRVFVFDNPEALDRFMVKHNITKWDE